VRRVKGGDNRVPIMEHGPESAVDRTEESMERGKTVRKSLIVAIAVLANFVPAGTAWARGGDWQKVDNQPLDAPCGSTTVRVTFPVDREYYRIITLKDGTQDQQITGRLVTNFATDSGASVSHNTSGPTDLLTHPNGDFEVVQRGALGDPGFFLPSGHPDIFVGSGLLDDIFHPDGSITYVTTPHHIIDVCAELGLSG
jgi:hypothetical protein